MLGQPKPDPAGPGSGSQAEGRPGAVEGEQGEQGGSYGGPQPHRRGPRHEGQRRSRVTVRLSPAEAQALRQAARTAGLTLAGYTAQVALAAAAGMPGPRPAGSPRQREARAALAELVRSRTELRSVGTNLNQAVKVANTTGSVPPDLLRLLAAVDIAVRHVDAATVAVLDRDPT